MATRTRVVNERTGPREGWLAHGIIAGFVAVGISTAVLFVAYLAANAAGTTNADIFRYWLWQLTHNAVVSFSQTSPAAALAVHVVVGLIFSILYAGIAERWFPRSWAGWQRGMVFSLILWVLSLVVFLPAVGAGFLGVNLGAGPLPIVGNLLLHLFYGYTLGRLFDVSADQPNIAQDTTYDEPYESVAVAHFEVGSATGIVVGIILGAIVGLVLARILPPLTTNTAFEGWAIAIAIGGLLAGGAVGGVVGSFAGLPQHEDNPAEATLGPDPFQMNVLPFLIPPALFILIAVLVSAFGTTLLALVGQSEDKMPAVWAALAGIVVIGGISLILALRDYRDESRSARETVSHSGH